MPLLIFFSSFIISLFSIIFISGSSPAEKLLQKSINYHDPLNHWSTFSDTLHFVQEGTDGTFSKRKVFMDNRHSEFSFWSYKDDGTILFTVSNGQTKTFWNGREQFDKEIEKQYRITPDRALMYRDYYLYLYGLPMKLKDPGTIIHPEVSEVDFYGFRRLQIKATYSVEVGKDTWYFYFNPKNSALTAYQFYHDESKNDGEYILLEGETRLQGIRIPKTRSWYTNKEERFLGKDILSN